MYISSTEFGEGHLFVFDMLTAGIGFMVRKLSNVENSHLLSKNGVFVCEKFTKVLFHYFTDFWGNTDRLSYSLNINLRKAYFSIKSKAPDMEITSVIISATDGHAIPNGQEEKFLEIRVQ